MRKSVIWRKTGAQETSEELVAVVHVKDAGVLPEAGDTEGGERLAGGQGHAHVLEIRECRISVDDQRVCASNRHLNVGI